MPKLQDLGLTCRKWLNKGVDEVNIVIESYGGTCV